MGVELVEIDIVGSKPLEAVFCSALHIIGTGALPLVIDRHPELGRDDHIITPGPDRASEDLFALRAAVCVGRVEEIDAHVEGGIYYLC